MRRIIVISMITLDGVLQAPGGPEEDTSGGFKYGGWTAGYDDEVASKVLEKQMQRTDYLLGRKTFGPPTGRNMPTLGQASMRVQNT